MIALVSVNMFCAFIMSAFDDVLFVVFVYAVIRFVRKESKSPIWVENMEMLRGMATLMYVIPVLIFPKLSKMTW